MLSIFVSSFHRLEEQRLVKVEALTLLLKSLNDYCFSFKMLRLLRRGLSTFRPLLVVIINEILLSLQQFLFSIFILLNWFNSKIKQSILFIRSFGS